MKINFHKQELPCLWRATSSPWHRIRSTIASLATIATILSGCASKSASNLTTSISTVPPESVKPEEIANYARAIMAIESKRQGLYTQIQQVIKKQQVPDINCTKPDTISSLSGDPQKLAVAYCNQAKEAIESNKLTITRFNEITVTARDNPNLEQRIQTELIRINQR
ncbi:MAG TPA: hypothetical protein DEG17_18770 [Cyanobacteria bacterium UBA11149]|nr:hypothetical protein [Cyanobacteria bacterium UBA11367]HBE56177.1 hypothetical protein [Cyanobacteria bacterium UBA11366]HBK62198.1 hypothetical protein [Cyanobacteria bacterium UBA11166]HBR73893.1 hypothetical protein [Cyanobacteria bacterium UBA11159]HBS70222.1 hypothetical protein [Cyanobacteria bacterium UBA11153]HBW90855.1 hypothetical protein [Cyanobacteria bacterium UBA11149]HCA96349.1 hypothetical protein [Cyanobacteria bacterium UBA9226]